MNGCFITYSQFRYFRECDLDLHRKREPVAEPDIYSEEWIGEHYGRAVAVRFLRPEHVIEVGHYSKAILHCSWVYFQDIVKRTRTKFPSRCAPPTINLQGLA